VNTLEFTMRCERMKNVWEHILVTQEQLRRFSRKWKIVITKLNQNGKWRPANIWLFVLYLLLINVNRKKVLSGAKKKTDWANILKDEIIMEEKKEIEIIIPFEEEQTSSIIKVSFN